MQKPIPLNEGLGETISLIRLSDAFRRHARYDEPAIIETLVKEARHLTGQLNNYNYGFDELHDNRRLVQNLRVRLLTMAALGAQLDAKSIELPVSRESEPVLALMREKVFPGLKLPLKFIFQAKRYDGSDLSEVSVDPSRRTMLDPGYRGEAKFVEGFKSRPENCREP